MPDLSLIHIFACQISHFFRYTDIIRRISKEVGDLTRNESEIHKTIKDINDDFVKRNFAGVIKEIALRPLQSSDKLMQLLLEIKRFNDENQYNMGKVDLFSQDSREDVNATAVRYLLSFMKYLLDEPGRKRLALADTFKLEFRVKELYLIHILSGYRQDQELHFRNNHLPKYVARLLWCIPRSAFVP